MNMDRSDVLNLVCATVSEFAAQMPAGAPATVDESTRLFGAKGFLDSLNLVSVVLDVEQQVNDRYDLSISLADDRAVSQERSPFRSVASLTDYIVTLAAEQQEQGA
jgi:acyl carrier protein